MSSLFKRGFYRVFKIVGAILLVLSLQLPTFSQEKANADLNISDPEMLVELEPDYTYAGFTATNDLLAWFEIHTSTLYIHDLERGKTKEISLKEGRGPGELQTFTDLAIIDERIYIADIHNYKIIEVDISSEKTDDITFNKSNNIFRIISDDQFLYMIDGADPKVYLYSYNLEEKKIDEFSLSDSNMDENLSNVFLKDGSLVATQDFIHVVTKLEGNIHTFGSDKQSFEETTSFDNTSVEVTRREASDGAQVTSPPAEVELTVEGAVTFPFAKDKIYILAEGETEHMTYRRDELYEFDLEKKRFTNTIEVGTNVDDMTANDNYIFMYSEEDYTIYREAVTH